jgi:hypothetical protein
MDLTRIISLKVESPNLGSSSFRKLLALRFWCDNYILKFDRIILKNKLKINNLVKVGGIIYGQDFKRM